MTDAENARKMEELDRLLNDPDVPMQPDRVWALLAEISRQDRNGVADDWIAPNNRRAGTDDHRGGTTV